MAFEEGGCGDMGGMIGVDGHIGHSGDNGGQDNVPVLGGILVQSHLHALQAVDHAGEGHQRLLEACGNGTALIGRTGQLEHYNMLYHNLFVWGLKTMFWFNDNV